MSDSSKFSISEMTTISLLTAVLCILAPISIPIGAVPITLTNVLLYSMLLVFGCKRTLCSYILYLFLGFVGLPVFSGFSGGFAKLAGPTGGYLIGFIFSILLFGLTPRKTQNKYLPIINLGAGTILFYAFGTIWYCIQMQTPIATALMICVIPFIPVDILKLILAARLAPALRKTLHHAHLINL